MDRASQLLSLTNLSGLLMAICAGIAAALLASGNKQHPLLMAISLAGLAVSFALALYLRVR